ncbi:MAG TPA: hypothetical protein VFX78_03630 [Candidatus Eisenbacteria bacterium]|nr:hypothetical protein [Candidatus Eisenbacteria bacterium]
MRATLLCIAFLVAAGCGEDSTKPSTDNPPVVVATSPVLGTTGYDLNVPFEVYDPDGDAIDTVFVSGAADSFAYDGASRVGRGIWRVSKPGTYQMNIGAYARGKLGTKVVNIAATGTANHYINIIGGVAHHFDPETLFVRFGETVAWRNVDTAPHNIYMGTMSVSGVVIDRVNPGCESKALLLSNPDNWYFCTLDTLHRTGAAAVFVY